MKSLLFVLSFWVLVSAELPRFPQVRPVDEAMKDSNLAAVRQEALKAVTNRDVTTLMAFVSPNVAVDGTKAKGDANWRVVDRWLSNKDDLGWRDIQKALSLGG